MYKHLLLLATVSTFAACASAPPDPNAPRACVTVDNTDGGSAVGRVYLVRDGREFIRLGEIGMGRKITECIQRTTLYGEYQINVYSGTVTRMDPAQNQNQPPTLESQTFRLSDGDEIEWNVALNRIRLLRQGGGPGS